MKNLAQGHMASRLQSWEPNPGRLAGMRNTSCCSSLTTWPWANLFTSLNLSFPFSETGIITVP